MNLRHLLIHNPMYSMSMSFLIKGFMGRKRVMNDLRSDLVKHWYDIRLLVQFTMTFMSSHLIII